MTKAIKLFLIFLLLGAGLFRCKQNYVSPYVSPHTGYLVVEGYISGNGPTQFTLSRTVPLPGSEGIPLETGAQVQVEGSDSSVYPLMTKGVGVYGADTLAINPLMKYRLRITTTGGEKYLSDFVPFKPTPAIDSINWIQGDSLAVDIYANAHDVTNSTRYYQWQFDETWEYHSAEQSSYKYDPDTIPVMVVPRDPSEYDFRCWHSGSSTSIILGSTVKLAQDLIYQQPVQHISPDDQRLSVLYSILVRQYALTEDGYNFLSLMQKNSESLGSIFDVQPSQINGNIHSLTNPAEQVIGYISAGTVQQQRIFITRSQLSQWLYRFTCENPDGVVLNDPDSLKKAFSDGSQIPITLEDPSHWYYNEAYCVDCKTGGGTTEMPAFWPH